MTRPRPTLAILLGILAQALACGTAHAVCNITSTGMSMSPGTANTGTYTFPNAPGPQVISVTITGRYSVSGGGTCSLALSFQRSSYPPATMASTSGGGATLPYTIQSAAGGGNTLLFTGSSVSSANVLQYSFAPAVNNGNRQFTANLTVYASMLPNSPQVAGSYSDTLTAWVFNLASGSSVFSRAFTVTGTVSKVCTIGGVANPAADTATIPVSAAGAVNAAVISRTYANVACNTPSSLQLTSQSGGVRTAASPPSGFTNVIDYTSSATFSGATASLDTSVYPLAAGPEAGAPATITGTAPSGTLSLTISPHANTSRLMSGTYTDTLTITVMPQ